MYTLVNAVLLDKGKTSQLRSYDVTDITLDTLLTGFQTGYLVLKDSYDPDNYYYLDIDVMQTANLYAPDYNIRIPNWLQAVGSLRLPTTMDEPSYSSGKLHYTDTHQAGYEVEAVNASSTIEGQPRHALSDLYIWKKSFGVSGDLANNVLATVNGLLHFAEPHKEGIVVRDGLHVIDKCGETNIGLISAMEVGGVQQIKISGDMVKGNSGLSLYQEMFFETGIDLSNKSVIVSIAGVPYYQSDLVRVIHPSQGVIAIDLASSSFSSVLPRLLQQIPLPGYEEEFNGKLFNRNTLVSDAFIRALLNSPTSFIAVFNQPFMVIEHSPLFSSGVTGTYHSPDYSFDIVTDEYGRIIPYFYNGSIKFHGIPDKHVITTPLFFREKRRRVVTLGMLGDIFPEVDESETYASTPSSLNKMKVKFYVKE